MSEEPKADASRKRGPADRALFRHIGQQMKDKPGESIPLPRELVKAWFEEKKQTESKP